MTVKQLQNLYDAMGVIENVAVDVADDGEAEALFCILDRLRAVIGEEGNA